MDRVVPIHGIERLSEGPTSPLAKPRGGGEHAVRVRRRCPHFCQRSGGHEAALLNSCTERASDGAGVGGALEHRLVNIKFTGASVPVLAQVRVEAERAVVPSLSKAFGGKEIHRQDGGVAAVAATERERST